MAFNGKSLMGMDEEKRFKTLYDFSLEEKTFYDVRNKNVNY